MRRSEEERRRRKRERRERIICVVDLSHVRRSRRRKTTSTAPWRWLTDVRKKVEGRKSLEETCCIVRLEPETRDRQRRRPGWAFKQMLTRMSIGRALRTQIVG